jgi:hypothetical protein
MSSSIVLAISSINLEMSIRIGMALSKMKEAALGGGL